VTQPTGDNRDIQLPGYTLVERIGAGGYGEVWLAHAPGGLTKAVKFIFGFHNEKRAASELHSLEKIKQVRHPFLLSLERIEVLEGRLVIVTELADGSLKDRFDQSVQNGLPGIPREELLGYLRDSADALDYLSDKHSLQHLDVKPENLLLLAGHIKVADFGLVKEIQETQASLVGGMTPLYSAPEVFQGLPTSFSDQYSLAVLFQEMLTGTLPFDGATAAELTLQHMHDEPNLSPLPLADRYVLARALSKNPQQRYPSCRDLVQALFKANVDGDASEGNWTPRQAVELPAKKQSSQNISEPRPGTVTQVFEDDLLSEVSKSMLIDLPPVLEGEVPNLPALDLQPSDFRPTPTLVIGIGGTAGHVLSHFRKRLNRRLGGNSSSHLPAVQLLLLDTDKRAILEAAHGDADSGLNSEETLTLQLRRPQEYRDHARRLLSWLSRRWLYNIPKSLRTEGLRPLGRLAFTDHARLALQRIRLALLQARDEQAIAESSEKSGLAFDGGAVRVYIVASISGGTGSGMSLDVGYAVKGLLEKLGIENATTTGVLLHSTGRDSRYCDLAKVNAFSWLKEYNHFARPEGYYPGDEASGLPAMPSGTPAFDNTYLVHLGDGLTAEQLKQQADGVAQYLYLDSLTAAQTFFETSREALSQNVSGSPTLRTFGLHEDSSTSQQALEVVTQQLCHRVVLGWSGEETESLPPTPNNLLNSRLAEEQETASISDTSHIISGAPRAVAQLQLNLEGISANARTILESQFGSNIEALLTKLIADQQQDRPEATLAEVLQVVDTLFASAPGSKANAGEFVFGRRLETIVSPLGMKLTADLQQWLLHRLDERQERLTGTQQAAEWFAQHLQRVETDASRLGQAIGRKLVDMTQHASAIAADTASRRNAGAADSVLAVAIQYFRLRLDLRALQATSQLTRMLQLELKNIREAIVEFGRHLRHLADTLTQDSNLGDEKQAGHDPVAPQEPIIQTLLASLSGLTSQVDQDLQEQFISQQGGLFQTVMGNRKVMSDLLDTLQSIARQHVALAAREFDLSGEQTLDKETLLDSADQLISPLMNQGGSVSQLVVLPQQGNREQQLATVRDALGSETSLLAPSEGNRIVCSEVGQIPLARVAVKLIERRRDYAEFADRVHTRNDISWTPLIDIPSPTFAPAAVSEFVTQVL